MFEENLGVSRRFWPPTFRLRDIFFVCSGTLGYVAYEGRHKLKSVFPSASNETCAPVWTWHIVD